MPPNQQYLTMGNYGMGQPYQSLAPFAMTQPEAPTPWWQQPVVQPRAFNVGNPAGASPVAQPVTGNGAWLGAYEDMGPSFAGGQQRGIMDSFLQQRNIDGTTSGGYGQAGLGILQGVGNLYLGMQQYGLAKEALANSKSQFERNYAANKTTTNNAIENRYTAAAARGNTSGYQSVSDYMKTHGVA